jgi:hypothetical protein
VRKLFTYILWTAAGTLGSHQVSAQQTVPKPSAVTATAPASPVAHNPSVTSGRPVSPPVNATAQRPDTTKVVQIYGGSGYFDLALAEKLRPELVKGLASTRSNALPAPPVTISVPVKAEGPKNVTEVSNL